MKWNGMGRGLKATAVSLALGLGITACSRDYTLAYLYVTSATRTNAGLVNAYAVDYQSGALQELSDSPLPSGGSNPVTLVATPNAKYVYVVNHDTSNVVQFDVGTDGKLYAQSTTGVVLGAGGVVGTFPTAAAVDPNGKFLFVTFQYQNGFTTARPGPGGVAVFPIDQNTGALGAPVANGTLPYFTTGLNPSGIVVSPKGNSVYVIDQDKLSSGVGQGLLLSFNYSLTTGALTTATAPVNVGTTPSAIAEDPASLYIYVTDSTTNQLFAFSTTTGGPLALLSSPFNTGQYPLSVKVDPRGTFVYVANFGSSSISAFTIGTGGALSSVAGGIATATGPNCITIDPALGIYLYTSNNTDNSVSAQQLDPHTGSLKAVQGTQFSAAALPTCAVTVANGAHPTSLVN